LGLVDQAVFEQSLEDSADRSRQNLVHGETLARPIHAVAQAFHLAEDLPAVLFFPLPDPLDEPLAGQIVTGLALSLFQMPLSERLSGDARVVRPRQLQCFQLLYTGTAGERVLDGVAESVAQVQYTSDVGRGNHDGERCFTAFGVDFEVAGRVPVFVKFVLYLPGGVLGGEMWGTVRGGFFSHKAKV